MISTDSRSEIAAERRYSKDDGSTLILILDEQGGKSLFEAKEDKYED